MRLARRLIAFWHRRQLAEEFDEETRFHVDRLREQLAQAGLDSVAATATASRQLGSASMFRDQARDVVSLPAVERAWRDLRHGTRSLLHNPAMSVVAVASLALGIAVTTTVFSVVDAMLLHDVTARNAHRLVSFEFQPYAILRELQSAGLFEELAAGNQCGPIRWRDGGQTKAVSADCLSANFFSAIGGAAILGHLFDGDEADPQRDPRVVVVSDRFWRRLGASPSVVGQTITLNETSFAVVGVLPPDYRAIQGYGIAPDLFLPYSPLLQPRLLEPAPVFDQVRPIGRLRSDRTRQQTEEALNVALSRIRQRYPTTGPGQRALRAKLTPVVGLAKYDTTGLDRSMIDFSKVSAVTAVLVLLISCGNVAGLLIASGATRRREIAIRQALGASRLQLVRQLLLESAILAVVGAVLGLLFTYWIAGLLSAVEVPVQDVVLRFAFSPDWRFILVAMGVGVFATFATGVIPAFASSAVLPNGALRDRSGATPRLRLRTVAVTAQVGLSIVLLSAAFLFARGLSAVDHADPGFDVEHTLWLDTAISRRLPIAEQIARRDRLYHALQEHAGVEAVSWAWYLPFQVVYPQPMLRSADGGIQVRAIEQGIGPDYLKTLNIPLLSGREFNSDDVRRRPNTPPVIVNETFARTFFPGAHAVGQRVLRVGVMGAADVPLEIVGVSRNADFRAPGEAPAPLLQSLNILTPSFVVRTRGPAPSMSADLSQLIDRTISGAAGGSFTMGERLSHATFPLRAAALLLMVLAAAGLVLAAIGLAGMMIYNVTRRTAELGIRLALGATARDVSLLAMADGFRLVAVGVVFGLGAGVGLNRSVIALLSAHTAVFDPWALSATMVTITSTTTLSIWLPCRRITRIDPATSLRME